MSSSYQNLGAPRAREFASAGTGIDVSALGGPTMGCWGIYCPTSGILKVRLASPIEGAEYEIFTISAGMTLPLRIDWIHQDTTVTDFIVFWGSP